MRLLMSYFFVCFDENFLQYFFHFPNLLDSEITDLGRILLFFGHSLPEIILLMGWSKNHFLSSEKGHGSDFWSSDKPNYGPKMGLPQIRGMKPKNSKSLLKILSAKMALVYEPIRSSIRYWILSNVMSSKNKYIDFFAKMLIFQFLIPNPS